MSASCGSRIRVTGRSNRRRPSSRRSHDVTPSRSDRASGLSPSSPSQRSTSAGRTVAPSSADGMPGSLAGTANRRADHHLSQFAPISHVAPDHLPRGPSSDFGLRNWRSVRDGREFQRRANSDDGGGGKGRPRGGRSPRPRLPCVAALGLTRARAGADGNVRSRAVRRCLEALVSGFGRRGRRASGLLLSRGAGVH